MSPFFRTFAGIMQTNEKFIYSQPVLDFVTISTEFCKYLEQSPASEQRKFIDVMRGLLSMLYLKTSLLGEIPEAEGYNEPCVTEEDYNFIRYNVAGIMAENDDFLDVMVENFKYSDQPVLCTISENIADIYQIIRELVEAFRGGYEEAMLAALAETMTEFELQWGQKLLNALRALHEIRFSRNELE